MPDYPDFWKTTPEGESYLLRCLENDPEALPIVRKRLADLERLDERRCHVSKGQRDFLRRVIASFEEKKPAQ